MSKFTQVSIRRGTEGLGRSKGFWSGKDILFNNDESTIYVLDENATTQDLLDTFRGVIEANLRNWVLSDMRRNIEFAANDKGLRIVFSLRDIPSLKQPKWMRGLLGVSLIQMVRCWQNDGKTPDQLCEFLADEWVAAWRNDANIYPYMHYGIPEEYPLARLLLVRWDRMDGSMPLQAFLQGLWNLAEMDLSGARFLGPGKHQSNLYNNKKNYNTLRDGLRADELELLRNFGYGVHLEGEWVTSNVRTIVSAAINASQAILVLSEKGLLLPPANLGGDPVMRIHELGWTKPFYQFIRQGYERIGIGSLLVASTIREIEDIPADLTNIWKFNLARSYKGLRRMLPEYGEKNALTAFDVTPFERGVARRVDHNRQKWRQQWFKDQGHPDVWCKFAEAAFNSSRACIREVAQQLHFLCEWALDRFESPWDITPLDLYNPYDPKSSDTFAAFLKKRSANGGQDPALCWSRAAALFRRVKNISSIPEYPWYQDGAVNPFEKLDTPFKGNRNRNQKTHRPRIATLIHERMIEILLDLDKQGKPTFNWARTQFAAADSNADGIWCPSRWTTLAVLLLLPLRRMQARWLDQGLMDEKVFDPETFQLVCNSHHLREYKYEDGQTHLERYGRPSGVIQQMTEDYMGTSSHIGLFIATNKTQLWNPARRNGYELPWPDGRELLASDDSEVRQHGYWLRRVYEVLAYQYRYVMEHDPDPVPVSFADVHSDAHNVSVDKDCAERMPRFVPLCRDTVNKKQVVRNGTLRVAAMPLTETKIDSAYTALCMETEARLKAEGFDSVSLTQPQTKKGATKIGITSRKPKYDIHCLRVAGISRLIEIGIDPVIVQEFVAGQLTLAMTHHYFRMQPWHVREKIIEAIVNGDFKLAIETFSEKVAKGEWKRGEPFVGLPRFREHVASLPEDFVCFSVVKGGICVMGGKGDACNEGGVYERQYDGKGAVEVEFGPVAGGCGNCIFFRTTAFLLQEQTLVLNILLAELRAQARERKELRTKITNLTCEIDEAEGATEKNRLVSDKSLHEARIEELNHDMVPRLTEWVNRYIMLQECESQLDELMKGNAEATALVAPFGENIGLTLEDLKVDQEMTPDIGLIGRIVEGSRILGARGIAVPEDYARFLERGVDKLLRLNGAQYLLLDVPDGARVKGASIMFNALEDLVGAEAIQRALDSDQPLALPDAIRKNVNQFAEALVGAAKSGRLTLANILEEGRSCNMISGSREADGRWEM